MELTVTMSTAIAVVRLSYLIFRRLESDVARPATCDLFSSFQSSMGSYSSQARRRTSISCEERMLNEEPKLNGHHKHALPHSHVATRSVCITFIAESRAF